MIAAGEAKHAAFDRHTHVGAHIASFPHPFPERMDYACR